MMLTIHTAAGIVLLAATLALLAVRYRRAPKRGVFRVWGWAGFGIIAAAEVLLARRAPFVTTFFTPIAWTGYLLFADALAGRVAGHSRLADSPRAFLNLAAWSVPLWLIFEAYNARLANWAYVGLPASALLSSIGYAWSFATIWPAIFETADLIRGLGILGSSVRPWTVGRATRVALVVAGLAMVTVPVSIPRPAGQYLFGAVWIGFVLLLDPLNERWGGASFLAELARGEAHMLTSLLAAGWVCGIVWEFWNYWAGAKWLYIFPIMQGWKIFEMPVAGYLGFLPFALECRVMYEFVSTMHRRLSGWGVMAGKPAPASELANAQSSSRA